MAEFVPAEEANLFQTEPDEQSWLGVDSLLKDLENLLQDKETADVIYLVGEEEEPVYAHRLIVHSRCQQFRKRSRELQFKLPSPNAPLQIKKTQFRPEIFKSVLRFIYTGKIELSSSTAFEVLQISEDLEITDLHRACEDFFTKNLSVENAAEFLNEALAVSSAPGQSGPTGLEGLVERCVSFIEENAEEVSRTEGFYNLPKNALIRLISSNQFALEEEEVWRSVLIWAKRATGINKPTAEWNEEEKKAICQQLSGVIEHVKLLLVDSTVFAEEVEPTGAVPMELSLERYRYAAVPTRFRMSQDPRLQPRSSNKLFYGTTLLLKDRLKFQKILNMWYGNDSQEWRIIYKASRDGFDADVFHSKCDSRSPTITIVQSTRGHLCGGFTDLPWRSDVKKGKYQTSSRSFLFTLINEEGVPATKFPVVHHKYATLSHPNYGPMFGAGSDLCLATNCHMNQESYSNFPHSYAGAQASSTLLMGSYNFAVADYEVFVCKGNIHNHEPQAVLL